MTRALIAPGRRRDPWLTTQGLLGDKVLLIAIILSALAALPLYAGRAGGGLEIMLAAVAVVLAGVIHATARGTLTSRLTLALIQTVLVVLHIQLGRGAAAYHFGVFVTLAALLVYLDWRPIVLTAAAFIANHILLTLLQAAGYEVYALAEPELGLTLVQGIYIVAQTAGEVLLAGLLRNRMREGAELEAIVACVGRRQGPDLQSIEQIEVTTPTALALKSAMMRMLANAEAVISSHPNGLDQPQRRFRHDDVPRFTEAQAPSSRHAEDQEMSRAVETMRDIDESSRKIRDVIGSIDSLSKMTSSRSSG